MSFASALRAALPDRWRDGAPDRDICGHDLGAGLGTVRPRTADEVASVVRLAREHGGSLAVAGARTAYWRPLSFAGAVVVDTRGLDAVGAVLDGVVEVGAGASIGAVSDALSAVGRELPLHPDAYGDSTIGGMIATGLASGIGMGRTTLDGVVTGLEVVLGTGEILRTGASRSLGHGGFARVGLPDPTGLFVGAEGALGIVTAVCLRAPARRPRVALSWGAPGGGASMRAAVELAADLRDRAAFDTFRVEAKSAGAAPSIRATLILHSPFSEAELDARMEAASAMIQARFAGTSITTVREPSRFWGAPEEHWAQLEGSHFRGVDVVIGHAEAVAGVEVAGAIYERARETGTLASMRTALYFAPGYVNLGVHTEWANAAAGDAFVDDAARRLRGLKAVPYRWGRGWLGLEAEPAYRSVMSGLASSLDPDGVLRAGAAWEPE